MTIRFGHGWPTGAIPLPPVRLERIGNHLTRLLGSLGMAGTARVRDELDPAPQAQMEVQVHGVPQPFGARTFDKAWRAVTPAGHGPPTPDVFGLPTESAHDLVEHIVVDVVSANPECLVGLEQIDAFHASRRVALASWHLTRPRSGEFLREVLRLGYAVDPGSPSSPAWDDVGSPDEAVGQQVERVLSQVARPRIRIIASREDWTAITGERLPAAMPANATQLGPLVQDVRAQLGVALGVRLPPVWLVPGAQAPGTVSIQLNGPPGLSEQLGDKPHPEAVVELLDADVRRRPDRLLTVSDVERALSEADAEGAELVSACLARFPLVGLTRVLRALLWEYVSIRNLRAVLEALLALAVERPKLLLPEPGDAGMRAAEVCDLVRSSDFFRMSVTQPHVDATLRLHAVAIEPALETEVLALLDGRALRIRPKQTGDVPSARNELLRASAAGVPLLATSVRARRGVRTLLSGELRGVPVLARTEIEPALKLVLVPA